MAASPGRALRRAKSSRDDLIHQAVSRVASQPVRVSVGARRPAMDYAEVSSGQVSPIMQLSPPGSPRGPDSSDDEPSVDAVGGGGGAATAAAAAAAPHLAQGPAALQGRFRREHARAEHGFGARSTRIHPEHLRAAKFLDVS